MGKKPALPIGEAVINNAESAINFANKKFNITLDYSEDSLEHVEGILADMHRRIATRKSWDIFTGPSTKEINTLAITMGCYLGEVIRRRWGGEWVVDTENGPAPAFRMQDTNIYPPSLVYNRIMKGDKESIWAFYRALARHLSKNEASQVQN